MGCNINRFRILEKQIFEKLTIASKCPRNHFNSFIHKICDLEINTLESGINVRVRLLIFEKKLEKKIKMTTML